MPEPPIKLDEPTIEPNTPWTDDALQRETMAKALTNLVRGETNPLVLSLNGGWGTGKTFFLERWKAQLESEGFKAIYFNAWEDDYCGDPLVAVIGQLWESLKGPDFEEFRKSIKDAAKPLFTKTIFNAVRAGTGGVVDLNADQLKSLAEHAVDDYSDQRGYKEELKVRLGEMAQAVATETEHPLVFIIDELDRCRPTFAIEMLERVKHIFDIPNLVFILGLDREQLRSSIRSVYGGIDVDGYLRRFFDMEFSLPDPDSRQYCKHLMARHDLSAYSKERTKTAGTPSHEQEYDAFAKLFATLCCYLGLSLRDIEYIIRSFVLVARNTPGNCLMYPELLAVLLLLRVKHHNLYLEYVKGRCPPCKVLDYLCEFVDDERLSTEESRHLDVIEGSLYLTDPHKGNVTQQLHLLQKGESPSDPNLLSERTKKKDPQQMEFLISWVDNYTQRGRSPFDVGHEVIQSLHNRIEQAALMSS